MTHWRYKRGPTPRQREIHAFICAFLRVHERTPTIREIAARFRFRSSNSTFDHLRRLERHGLIERTVHYNPSLQNESAKEPVGTRSIKLLCTDDGRPIILGVSQAVRDQLLAFHDEVVAAVEANRKVVA